VYLARDTVSSCVCFMKAERMSPEYPLRRIGSFWFGPVRKDWLGVEAA